MRYTETDFEEYKSFYWDKALEKLYACDGDLFNTIYDMLNPQKSSKQFDEARMIVCGLACHGILAYMKKQHAMDDSISEFEESEEAKEFVLKVIEKMWDDGDHFQEFFEPPFE